MTAEMTEINPEEAFRKNFNKKFNNGDFRNPVHTGCRAVSHDDKISEYPYTKEEWKLYRLELWDKLHYYLLNDEAEPTWDEIKFQLEDDYFAGSFSDALDIWIMAINKLDNDTVKYDAYNRVFNGVDLFETIDLISPKNPKQGPGYEIATKKIQHVPNKQKIKMLNSKRNYNKICKRIIYPQARVPVLVKKNHNNKKFTVPADFPNGTSILEHPEFLAENITKWCKSGAVRCIGKVGSKQDKKFIKKGNFFNASIFVVTNGVGKNRLIWNGHPLKVVEKYKKPCVLDDIPKLMKIIQKDDIVNKFDDSSGKSQSRHHNCLDEIRPPNRKPGIWQNR